MTASRARRSSGDITFQLTGDPEEVVVYESLVESFEKANPEVTIKMVPLADKDDHLAKLTTAFSGGTPPDVFLLNFREYSQFVETGAVQPIGPELESLGIDTADYYEPPVDAFTYDDELQCMPQNVSSLAVYYNKQLFKKAGLDAPQEGWSWEDFRQTAIELTGGDVRGVGIEANIIRLAPFAWSNGGEIVDDPENPTTFTLDDPATREALEFFVQLAREDEVIPTEEEIEAAEDLESMFAGGKLGMLLTSRRDTPEFREVAGLKWDVAALPVAEEPVNILHSDAYCVASESEEHDAAFEFIKYATGERGQTITALGGRTVPSLKSVASSGAFLNPAQPPKNSQIFLDATEGMRATPVLAHMAGDRDDHRGVSDPGLLRGRIHGRRRHQRHNRGDDAVVRRRSWVSASVAGLRKSFQDRKDHRLTALDGVDLDVPDGELMVIVGPSGSGKTTLLRCIAGLEQPDDGSGVRRGPRRNRAFRPALATWRWSFRTSPCFLTCRRATTSRLGSGQTRWTRGQVVARVDEVAELLGLQEALDRRPGELSGGERQRVALARAIVREPAVFLLDEPLSNLDAELRTITRAEIRTLQRRLGTTAIYVTHDQVEAMTMGDRVAVLRDGHVEQVARPTELYDRPATAFVARFLGSPPMNVFPSSSAGRSRRRSRLGSSARARAYLRSARGHLARPCCEC